MENPDREILAARRQILDHRLGRGQRVTHRHTDRGGQIVGELGGFVLVSWDGHGSSAESPFDLDPQAHPIGRELAPILTEAEVERWARTPGRKDAVGFRYRGFDVDWDEIASAWAWTHASFDGDFDSRHGHVWAGGPDAAKAAIDVWHAENEEA